MSHTRRTRTGRLQVMPVSYRTACAFLRAHHCHHAPPQGHDLSIGLVAAHGDLAVVAMVGRPVACHLDGGCTAEPTRLASDTARSAGSAFLAVARRGAWSIGHECTITYAQQDEPGTVLRAARWRPIIARPTGSGWDRPGRLRPPTGTEHNVRILWQVALAETQRRHTRRIPPPSSDELDRYTGHGVDRPDTGGRL
jgi:hypothetical protein